MRRGPAHAPQAIAEAPQRWRPATSSSRAGGRPGAAQTSSREIIETRRRLDALAKFLDSALVVPGTTVRVGADAILNLIPGIGTLAAKAMAAYLIWEARRLGVPRTTLLRMVGNVGIDLLISAVPIAGWVGDVFYRSNLRNVALLRRHLSETSAGAAADSRQPHWPDGGERARISMPR